MITMPRFIALGFYLLMMGGIANAQQDSLRPFMPEFFAEFPNVRDLAISPDGQEMFFTVESFKKEFSAIYHTILQGDAWAKPQVASFSGQYSDLEPFFDPRGYRLFFVSKRPVSKDSIRPKDADIWVVERVEGGWGQPQRLPNQINSDLDEFYPAVTSVGTVYFTRLSSDPKRKEDIFACEWMGDGYSSSEPVGGPNSDRYEFNAFVDAAEHMMIYTSYGRADDLGGGDLYVSYRQENHDWSPGMHLGPLYNSKRIDYCPFWDPRTQTLYITSERSSIPSHFAAPQSASELKTQLGAPNNGTSRIYFIEGKLKQ